jgi:hypothetical protein
LLLRAREANNILQSCQIIGKYDDIDGCDDDYDSSGYDCNTDDEEDDGNDDDVIINIISIMMMLLMMMVVMVLLIMMMIDL